MPSTYITNISKKTKISVSTLERLYREAKAAAKKQGKDEDYAYVTSIFKTMVKGHKKKVSKEEYTDPLSATW